jgi:hypothetical protein
MSMIDPKGAGPNSGAGFALAPDRKFRRGGDRILVNRMLLAAFADIEDGVEFWETIAGHRDPEHGVSREYLNRSG